MTIHDVGREGATSCLAMELVDGASLRDVLESRPMPVKKLLSIAAGDPHPVRLRQGFGGSMA